MKLFSLTNWVLWACILSQSIQTALYGRTVIYPESSYFIVEVMLAVVLVVFFIVLYLAYHVYRHWKDHDGHGGHGDDGWDY